MADRGRIPARTKVAPVPGANLNADRTSKKTAVKLGILLDSGSVAA
jgi:hypothetical protein